jgi:hypothetical protein
MSCPDCTTGVKLSGTPKGVMRDDGSYFAAAPPAQEGSSPDTGASPKRAVVLLTDAFGLGLDNPKIMADYFSEQLQCDAWIPDIFNSNYLFDFLISVMVVTDEQCNAGKPLVEEGELKMPERAGEKIGVLVWTKFFLRLIIRLPRFIANRPSVADKRIQTVRRVVHSFIFRRLKAGAL